MRKLVLLGFLLFGAGRALADSDGYFCSSEGYLAYELREWTAPEAKHVLNIMRVGGPEGVEELAPLLLADFQLHGLRCEPDKIVVLSWDTQFTVTSPHQGIPMIKSTGSYEPGRLPQGYEATDRLVDARKSRSVIIPSSDRKHTYELRIDHSEKGEPAPGGGGIIYHTTVSTLVQKDLSGKVIREKILYKGTTDEPID